MASPNSNSPQSDSKFALHRESFVSQEGDGRTQVRKEARKRKASTTTRAAYPRKRAVNACTVCRARRTKCDNKRPKCSFCESVGAECVIDSVDHSSFDPASLEIINRLQRLEQILGNHAPSQLEDITTRLQHIQSSLPAVTAGRPRRESLDTKAEAATLDSFIPQTVQNIVRWQTISPSLSPGLTHGQASSPVAAATARPHRMDPSSPSGEGVQLNYERCMDVTDAYIRYSNIRNPIFDEDDLRVLVVRVHAGGFEWDAESCLVLLVCANGALSMPFDTYKGVSESAYDGLADALFCAAEKRLGAAFSNGGLVLAQVLFLCGVFHMCRLRALEAWRMFHAAICVCQSFNCTLAIYQPPYEHSSFEERVYWSAWKSESELRWELGLRDFDTRAIDHPALFPTLPEDQNDSQLESWYFYLSEISLWRLHFSSEQETHRLVKRLEMRPLDILASSFDRLEQQVITWQQSLASPVHLGDFARTADREDSILTYILKSHVGNYYELITWPFVSAAINDGAVMNERTAELAAKGLYWHMIRLQVHSSGFFHRHHGTWLMQRRSTRSALMLLAAALTQSTTGLLPIGWETHVETTVEMLQYWAAEISDAGEYADLLRALLRRYREGAGIGHTKFTPPAEPN